jgi:thiamine transport system substrate-binding protein
VKNHRLSTLLAAALPIALLAACSSDGNGGTADAKTVTVVAYDSFTPSKEVLAAFTEQTGISVKVITSGDTGELVNKAILTQEDPLGDVLYGVDNTFLSRAVGEGLFTPYEAPGLDRLDSQFTDLVPGHQVTPVDYGDVCINYDKAALAKAGLDEPTTLDDLADPKYKDLTVVENPATSSPGLAFVMGTVAQFGDAWPQYWTKLRGNGVKVVSGWDQAWHTEFSAGPGAGSRPIVVSYASSPPAAVLFGPDPKAKETPIGVAESTCFRQVEFVGLMRKAKHTKAAQQFIDFTIGTRFQEDLPLNMFVFPVRTDAKLPELFTKFAVTPTKPLTLTPQRISAEREQWIDTWTSTVLD